MKIEIRQYKPEYAEVHYLAVKASIESLKKWFSWAKPDYCLCDSIKFTREQSERENEGRYAFAVFDNEDGEFVGNCGLKIPLDNSRDKTAILNYWRRSDTYKYNIISEAIKELIKMPEFHKLGISRIEMHIADCNLRSIGVAGKVGAKPECNMMVKDANGKEHYGKKYVLTISDDTGQVATKNE